MSDSVFLPGPGQHGLVSVIVPTYDRARIIRATVDSILAQSYPNFEAIVVDDGSRDNTQEVMASYTDPRVRYFRTPNGGMSAARNFGMDQARGEFIAFLDSDDVWLPWKLAAQMELLRRHPEVGMTWTDMATYTDDPSHIVHDRYIRTYYTAYTRIEIEKTLHHAGSLGDLSIEAPAAMRASPYYVGDVFREMFIGSLVHPSTAVVRRERLRQAGRFDFALTGPGAEDYHFYYRISEHGPVAFLDASTTLYRIGDPSALSAATLAQARGNLSVVLHWVNRKRPALPDHIERKRLASAYRWAGKEELYDGRLAAARSHLRETLRLERDTGTLRLYALSILPDGSMHVLRTLKRILKGKLR